MRATAASGHSVLSRSAQAVFRSSSGDPNSTENDLAETGIDHGMTNLQGRRALVHGASRGIGAEIVAAARRRRRRVAFTYGRHHAAEAQKLVAEVAGRRRESRGDPRGQRRIPEQVGERRSTRRLARLGGLDVLVSNAGVAVHG